MYFEIEELFDGFCFFFKKKFVFVCLFVCFVFCCCVTYLESIATQGMDVIGQL